LRSAIDYTKRARDHAIAAPVANIVLHEDGADFRPHDRSGWTRFKTTRFLAMFANIRQKNPAKRVFSVATTQEMGADDLTSFFPVLFQKHDVAPGRRAEVAGVVVGISRPGEAVIRHLVPFLARDLTRLAADANGRVGKKSYFDVIAHVGVLPLIRAMSAFADHRLSIFPSKP
jgi:hypothetical protein